ncbi:hypothetical protein [Pseudoduganella violaceinigra]|uniref:hypothetical protein n=1 Tax=Pseudoduganella violaceinigra TaxID=246602 RepID=UPI001B7F96ED|nr:hypothetical protein [Pseudoduganella violaceinigra]
MHNAISAALDAICKERDDQSFSEAFDAVDVIVREMGERDLANILFTEIPRSVPFEVVADLFNILAWQTSDNGAAMTRAIESWLIEGSDNRKLLIALNLDVYPFINAKEMETVLMRLTESNVRVAARCKELIRSRQNGASKPNNLIIRTANALRAMVAGHR